jgi:putative ABC transport system ATP-binding protein
VKPALAMSNVEFSYKRGIIGSMVSFGASVGRMGGVGGSGGADERFTLKVRSLTLWPGDQLLLTGSSGTGKSTLLHVIAGLVTCPATVAVNGTNIQALGGGVRDAFRGRAIGMIFQTFNLIPGMTASENVMLAMMFSDIPKREHAGQAKELLGRLGIDKYKQVVGTMSVGQQQRVAVARAVACKPFVVLADEPTASLDPDNTHGAMELIQQVCKERNSALLCVSHDPSMAQRFEFRASLADLASGPVGKEPSVQMWGGEARRNVDGAGTVKDGK